MIKKKTIWITEDGQEFSSKEEAAKAEEEYQINQKIYTLSDILRKYFKQKYSDHDRYDKCLYLCVDCGIKLLEYESNWDGHRTERGDLIFRHVGKTTSFLDGYRCENCDRKAFELFNDMIQDYNEKNKTDILIDPRNLETTTQKDKNMLLQILTIIEFWDDNH